MLVKTLVHSETVHVLQLHERLTLQGQHTNMCILLPERCHQGLSRPVNRSARNSYVPIKLSTVQNLDGSGCQLVTDTGKICKQLGAALHFLSPKSFALVELAVLLAYLQTVSISSFVSLPQASRPLCTEMHQMYGRGVLAVVLQESGLKFLVVGALQGGLD